MSGREALTGPGPTPCLPEPTGPCPVGIAALHLTDTSRPDPWAVGMTARELMVSLWYPAVPSDGRRAQYMSALRELVKPGESTTRGWLRWVPPGAAPPTALVRVVLSASGGGPVRPLLAS